MKNYVKALLFLSLNTFKMENTFKMPKKFKSILIHSFI